jgi:aldehyde dehydrogenase (NAD+)
MVIAMPSRVQQSEAAVPAEDGLQRAHRRHAQRAWAQTPLRQRLAIVHSIRLMLANHASDLTAAIPSDLARTPADTLAAEVLPLLEAARFLERQAQNILASRKLGRRGLPFWLSGIDATVERVPLGVILVVAPSNYPLFLPGVQALQALAAGNAVVWKPGRNSAPIAQLFARLCAIAGLPEHLLHVTNDSIATVAAEIAARPAKIIFTGSAAAGRAVQHLAAEACIPVVAELSGCDAVLALPSADPVRLIDVLCFGMRLNGSATCMAPRRLILVGEHHPNLVTQLIAQFTTIAPVAITEATRRQLQALLADGEAQGATVHGSVSPFGIQPIIVDDASPTMNIASTDIFAPVLTVLRVPNIATAIDQINQNPYGLTASIFGKRAEAQTIASQLEVGTIVINDLIVPTADPRIPFGGRRQSGFGSTRGGEGLLEMTAIRTTTARTSRDTKHFQPTGQAHAELFSGVIQVTHSATLGERIAGFKRIIAAARKL